MPKLYPRGAGFSMTGSALLPDTTIEQLATCGERVDSYKFATACTLVLDGQPRSRTSGGTPMYLPELRCEHGLGRA
jgi:hypothetical protein